MSPDESRAAALGAARELLIEAGPQAVTLKAVSARIGRTHANLLHHFGSASGLQKALAVYLADAVCGDIARAVAASRAGTGSARDIVDLAFDAFEQGGAAALTSWMLLTGNEDALDPIVDAIRKLVDELGDADAEATLPADRAQTDRAQTDRELHEDTLFLVHMALGDALIGERLTATFALPRTAARDIAARHLESALERWKRDHAV